MHEADLLRRLGGRATPFVFRSKLLPYVAPSTRDAEAGALVYAIKAMIANLLLLNELGFCLESDITPLTLGVDNTGAIATLTTDYLSKDSRWNSIRIGFLRGFVRENLVRPLYTPTADMLADPLTKVPSSATDHQLLRARLMGHA